MEARPLPVGVRDLDDGSLMLLFPPRLPDPAFDVLDVRQVRPLLAGFAGLGSQPGPRLRLIESPGTGRSRQARGMPGEMRVREEFQSLFDPSPLAVPESLETSRLFRALQLSPRFMGDGFRQAALELFTSPGFVVSVCLSVLLYFSAWLTPEPFFSKAFAATLTARLSLLVGLMEVARVAQACLRLYREAEAARSPLELEAAAERFGKVIGGTGLRVLVVVASLGVGKLMPEVPEEGIGPLLQSSRTATVGGPTLSGSVATAKIVADGTLVVTGAATGTVVSSGCGATGFAPRPPARPAGRSSPPGMVRPIPGRTHRTMRPSKRTSPPGRQQDTPTFERTGRK